MLTANAPLSRLPPYSYYSSGSCTIVKSPRFVYCPALAASWHRDARSGLCAGESGVVNSSLGSGVRTFLVQQFWWALRVPADRMGYDRRGLHTALKQRAHTKLDREVHIGLLTGGLRFPNIIALHAYWANERFEHCRVSVDPDPYTADVLWVYSQDPLRADRRRSVEEAIAQARPGTPIINHPQAYDFYHAEDAFARLEAAGVPVPRSRFGPADHGVRVIWKPVGVQSATRGPVAYEGDIAGERPFEYLDVTEQGGVSSRYRACYFLGEVFAASCMRAREPIVRYRNAVEIDATWLLTEVEVGHIKRIAEVSGLDFFTVDFLRRPPDKAPTFVDINSFTMFKDASPPGHYGHRHDFDRLRPADGGPKGAWRGVERQILELVRSARKPS